MHGNNTTPQIEQNLRAVNSEEDRLSTLFDEAAERNLLGLLILNSGKISTEIAYVPCEIFCTHLHQQIAAAVTYLAAHRLPIDACEVREKLASRGIRCALSYLSELSSGLVPGTCLKRRIDYLKELSHRRQGVALAEVLISRLCDISDPLDEIVRDAGEFLKSAGAEIGN